MVYRFGWLAGVAGLVFAFFGVNALLQPTVEGPPWQFVVASGVALGIVITWTGVTYRLNTWIVAGLNFVAMIIAVASIAAPETTAFVLPTVETWDTLYVEFDLALGIIRDGIEPVSPESGIVIIVMLLFWVVGALLAWGLLNGRAYVAVLPPLVLALQFATMDRAATTWTRVALFLLLVGGTMLAITTDERDQTAGRMARRGEWPSSRHRMAPAASALLAVTLVSSLGMVATLDERVPRDGILDWRTSTGLVGDFTGSVSYNPYVGIRQRLVNNSAEEVFYARVNGDLPPDQVYFRLVTMETYNGSQFYANKPEMFRREDSPWEADAHAFAGETKTIETDIQIASLRMDWLPAAYTPTAVVSTERVERSIRVRREDGSLRLAGGNFSFRGMEYSVRSAVPAPDVTVLATTPDGELSPAFLLAQSVESSELIPAPLTADEVAALTRDEPPNVEIYLDLPDDPAARIAEITDLAELRTKNLETPFEKALALEAWFHSPKTDNGDPLDGFSYTTDILPGHGATELSQWLLDPASPNYHIGYCENFATAMAIMARTLDIPSRVVLGFTPGEATISPDVVVVRNRNAHAWVELWMPTQGWVRFDPTPRGSQDTPQTFEAVNEALAFSLTSYLDVPDPEIPLFETSPLPNPLLEPPDFEPFPLPGGGGDATASGFSVPAWVRALLIVTTLGMIVFGTIPAVKLWRRRRRMKRLLAGDISAAWEEITSRLTDLGEAPAPSLTPDEYAAGVDIAMVPLASVYGRSLYGPVGTVLPDHVDAAAESLDATTGRLATRYSRAQLLVAWYRPGTLLPRRLRRHNKN